MMLPIRFLPEAREEFDRAIEWYRTRGRDLARDFVHRVGAVVRRVASTPKMHGLVHGCVRRAVVSRFPFVVLYCEDDGELLVIAVFHTSRDPDEWRGRVS